MGPASSFVERARSVPNGTKTPARLGGWLICASANHVTGIRRVDTALDRILHKRRRNEFQRSELLMQASEASS
jgi:hypothetical protein